MLDEMTGFILSDECYDNLFFIKNEWSQRGVCQGTYVAQHSDPGNLKPFNSFRAAMMADAFRLRKILILCA